MKRQSRRVWTTVVVIMSGTTSSITITRPSSVMRNSRSVTSWPRMSVADSGIVPPGATHPIVVSAGSTSKL